MAILGTVTVRGLFDSKGVEKGTKAASRSMKGFGDAVRRQINTLRQYRQAIGTVVGGAGIGLGGIGLGGLVAFTNRLAQNALQQQVFAQRLGLSSRELHGFHRAAAQLNIEQDVMNDALLELDKRTSEATTGTGSMFDALQMMNLEVEKFAKLSLSDRFSVVNRELQGMNASMRNFLTDEIYGGAADEISGMTDKLDLFRQVHERTFNAKNHDQLVNTAKAYNKIGQELKEIAKDIGAKAAGPGLEAARGARAVVELGAKVGQSAPGAPGYLETALRADQRRLSLLLRPLIELIDDDHVSRQGVTGAASLLPFMNFVLNPSNA